MKVPWYARLVYWLLDLLTEWLCVLFNRAMDGLRSLRNRMAWHVRTNQVMNLPWTSVYWAGKPGFGVIHGKGVRKWKDLSGNSRWWRLHKRHAIQKDPSKRPVFLYEDPVFNGNPSVQFQGVIAGQISEEDRESLTSWMIEHFGINGSEQQ